MNLSNQIHPPKTINLAGPVLNWMLHNYQRHLKDDGSVDAESLAEQAVWEFECNKELAEDLAAEVKESVDN